MPSIGQMSMKVTADMGHLLRDMQLLNKQLNNTASLANRAGSALKTMLKGLAFGGGLAIGGIFAGGLFGRNAIIDAHDFIVQAEGLGMTTEAWGRLKLAQMEVGGSTESLARMMQRLETNLGEAQLTGDKAQKSFRGFVGALSPAAKGLQLIGLRIEDLKDLKPDEHLRKISEAVLKLGTTEEQYAAIQGVIPGVNRSDAPRILAFMREVSTNWDEIGRKAKAVGFFVKPEDIEGLKQGRRALADLSAIWEGFKIQAGTQLAPVFANVLQRLMDWVAESGGVGKVIDDWVKGFHSMVGDAQDIGDIFQLAFANISRVWHSLMIGIARVSRAGTSGPERGALTQTMREHGEALSRLAGTDERIRQRALRRSLEAGGRANMGRFPQNLFNQSLRLLVGPNGVNWDRLPYAAGLMADAIGRAAQAGKKFSNAFKDADLHRIWTEQANLIHYEVMPAYSQLQDMLEQVGKAQALGGLSEEDANLKLLKEFNSLESGLGLNRVQLAGAAGFGSTEAASIMSNFEVRPSENVQERIANTLLLMERHEAHLRKVAEEVAKALRANTVGKGANVRG